MLVALFVALIAGTVDVARRLWDRGDVLTTVGMAGTAAVLAWWLWRCVSGWWRSRRGDDGSLASTGGLAWTVAIVALAAANVAAAAVLVSIAVDAGEGRPDRLSAAVDLLTVASNLWVLLYYRVPRAWNGRRAAHRPS